MSRFRLILCPRTPPTVLPPQPPSQGYDLTPKALPGAFRLGLNMSGPESGNSFPTLDMLTYWAAVAANLNRPKNVPT